MALAASPFLELLYAAMSALPSAWASSLVSAVNSEVLLDVMSANKFPKHEGGERKNESH